MGTAHPNVDSADYCMGESTDRPPEEPRIPPFARKSGDTLKREADSLVRRIDTWRREHPDDFTAIFTDSMAAGLGPEALFHPYPETARHMNSALGKTLIQEGGDGLGFSVWAVGLFGAFGTDSDWLSKTAAIVGFLPVVGDLLGLLEGATRGDWKAEAMSAAGLLAVLLGAAEVPVIGEVIDVVLGFVMLVETLVELFKDMLGHFGDNVDKLRDQRNKAWAEAVLVQCDTLIIPKMEEMWRCYEQSLLSSFVQVISMVDLKAEQAAEAAPLERKTVEAAAAVTKSHLWAQLGQLLADAAAAFQGQMQSTLVDMLTNRSGMREAFRQFTTTVIKGDGRKRGRIAAAWAHKQFANCMQVSSDCLPGEEAWDRNCCPFSSAEPNNCFGLKSDDETLSYQGCANCCADFYNRVTGEYLDKILEEDEQRGGPPDHVLDEVWADIFALFDKSLDPEATGEDWATPTIPNGRFFPRVLPPQALPAPHIWSIEDVWHPGQARLGWVAPKTLPRALAAKCVFTVYHNGEQQAEATADEDEMTYKFYVPGQGDFGRIKAEAWFGSADLTKMFPEPSGGNWPVDRRVWSPATEFGFRRNHNETGWEGDLTMVQANNGYGSLIGDYVMVNEATGMVAEALGAAARTGGAVAQAPLSGNASQVWALNSRLAGAPVPVWDGSRVVNGATNQPLDHDDRPPSSAPAFPVGAKVVQGDGEAGVDGRRVWSASIANPHEGDRAVAFRLNYAWKGGQKEDLVLYAPTDRPDEQLELWRATASLYQRWRFVPAPTTTPVPGRHYTILNDWNGLAVEVDSEGRPTLVVPNTASPCQVFQFNCLSDEGDRACVLRNRFRGVGLTASASGGGATAAKWRWSYTWGGAWRLHPEGNEGVLLAPGQTRAPSSPLELVNADLREPWQVWRLAEVAHDPEPGIPFLIGSALSGFVAGVADGSKKDWALVQQEVYTGGLSQLWTAVEESGGFVIVNLGTGGRLGIWSGDNLIYQRQNTNDDTVRWELVPAPSGAWVLRNKRTGTVLCAAGTDNDVVLPGHGVLRADYQSEQLAELWSLTPALPEGSFRIVSAATGLAAGPVGRDVSPDFVGQLECDPSDTELNQIWDLSREWDGSYVVVNAVSRKVLSLVGSGSGPNWVVQDADGGESRQRWLLQRHGDRWQLVSSQNELALEAVGDPGRKDPLEARTSAAGNERQQWELIEARPRPIPGQVYEIRSALEGTMLEPELHSAAHGKPVVLAYGGSGAPQQWRFLPHGSGARLVNLWSTLSLYAIGQGAPTGPIGQTQGSENTEFRLDYLQGYWTIRTSQDRFVGAGDLEKDGWYRYVEYRGKHLRYGDPFDVEPSALWFLEPAEAPKLVGGRPYIVRSAANGWVMEPEEGAIVGNPDRLGVLGPVVLRQQREGTVEQWVFEQWPDHCRLRNQRTGLFLSVWSEVEVSGGAGGVAIKLRFDALGGDWVISNPNSNAMVVSSGLEKSEPGTIPLIVQPNDPVRRDSAVALERRWVIGPAPGPELEGGRMYAIASADNGWVLEPEDRTNTIDRKGEDCPVVLRPRVSERDSQIWELRPSSEGTWEFLNKVTKKFLAIGPSKYTASLVTQVTAGSRATTQLRIEKSGDDLVIELPGDERLLRAPSMMVSTGLEEEGQYGRQVSLTAELYDLRRAERSAARRFFLRPT